MKICRSRTVLPLAAARAATAEQPPSASAQTAVVRIRTEAGGIGMRNGAVSPTLLSTLFIALARAFIGSLTHHVHHRQPSPPTRLTRQQVMVPRLLRRIARHRRLHVHAARASVRADAAAARGRQQSDARPISVCRCATNYRTQPFLCAQAPTASHAALARGRGVYRQSKRRGRFFVGLSDQRRRRSGSDRAFDTAPRGAAATAASEAAQSARPDRTDGRLALQRRRQVSAPHTRPTASTSVRLASYNSGHPRARIAANDAPRAPSRAQRCAP